MSDPHHLPQFGEPPQWALCYERLSLTLPPQEFSKWISPLEHRYYESLPLLRFYVIDGSDPDFREFPAEYRTLIEKTMHEPDIYPNGPVTVEFEFCTPPTP